ncbi:MAG: aldehyde dehydrogenase family protein [Planctomycetota bacterium]
MSDTLTSFNPATGEPVGDVPVTPAADVPRIVATARAAAGEWRSLPATERAALLGPAGARLVERSEEIGTLLTREMGKPLREGIGEAKGCGGSLQKFADGVAAALEPDTLEDGRTSSTVYYDPLGVCAAITPWNFPIGMPHSLVVPALVAGNTVVLKPSEETPLVAQAYVDVLNEVLPEGVLQIIHGADEQGKALVNADVDLVAFTGSRETGKKIMESASSGLKRVILELGGKDPMVVLGDADLDKAAEFAAMNSFRNAGQVCVSTERIYVDASVAADFESKVAAHAAEMTVGNGVDEGVQVGPMINARQRDHVLAQIDDACARGARVVYGGSGHHDNFVLPTVLADLDEDLGIMRDETFGPVACVSSFSDEEEAVRLANDTPFGLGAVVFGEPDHAAAVARRLEAGMIGINKGCGGASGTPWVGAKQSGYGYHSSQQGHRQFTQPRVVSIAKQ